MLTFIHGDNITASRDFFYHIKTKELDGISFDGKTLVRNDLVQVIEGGGLFSESKIIFIDQLLTLKGASQSQEIENCIVYLSKHSKSIQVYLWENADISKNKLLPKNSVLKTHNYPKEIFTFLDSLKPEHVSHIKLFHSILKTTEAEIIFALMVRQVRLLLALNDTGSENIDELKRLAPWQISKLKKQASYFSEKKLLEIYKNMFEIDRSLKVGQSALPLSARIDFLLLNI